MAEKQRVMRFCENRLIRRPDLPKLGFFLRSTSTLEAWYGLNEYLQNMSGKYILFICDRFAMPVSPYKVLETETIKELTNQDLVADKACNYTRADNDMAQHKTRFYDFIGIAAMGAVVAVVIVALLAMSGKIDLLAMFRGGK